MYFRFFAFLLWSRQSGNFPVDPSRWSPKNSTCNCSCLQCRAENIALLAKINVLEFRFNDEWRIMSRMFYFFTFYILLWTWNIELKSCNALCLIMSFATVSEVFNTWLGFICTVDTLLYETNLNHILRLLIIWN